MALVRVITGPRRNMTLALEQGGGSKILGRGEGANLILADKSASRHHSEIFYRDGQWFLADKESSNGTFLNEQRVTEPLPLKDNDQIRCGATVLLFEDDSTPWVLDVPEEEKENAPIELEFDPDETMVAVAYDNLQSKQSAQQRQRFQQAGQAALNLSHGIKNILQAVSTGREIVDMALTDGEMDTARKGWNILKRNLEQIQKLVLDMLKFSKEQSLKLQPCQFNRLVENAIGIAQSQARLRNVALGLQLDEQIGLVQMDPDRMQDVVLNLALNAVEAVEPDKGHVTITTEIDSSRSMLVLRVADNGPGIDDLSCLFEPFHSTKGQMGVGLGLAIVRKVVMQHKGAVDAQSIPGQGSVFTVRLPYMPIEAAVGTV